ncbi:MAG TPA: mannose-1-phosphate guanylyltransferase/mannose-6-phosphate isomerase [Mariprofundaceae bacterium]|nr:mannose-1-phosphate guanylyltransferase/mannose-6-phosphate isomerase [Mariprofundaceae bacterium]
MTAGKRPDVQAVILAGGSGTRLWPLSRQQLPKQFLRLETDDTLLGATVSRLAPIVQPADVWVVTNEALATGEAYDQLCRFKTVLEPAGRNTAPAIALAAALIEEQLGDAVMLVLPADHIIRNVPAFHDCLRAAIHAAEDGRLVTFGIVPTHAETGFGYIQASGVADVREVVRFVEKPDAGTAASFVASGDYFWNSGMFVWKASTILAEIRTHLPEVAALLVEMRSDWRKGDDWQESVRQQFARMPSISIDYGVLEKSSNVALVPADIAWSDVGSWDAVFDLSDKDAAGNAIAGNVAAIDCRNTLIRSESRLVAAVGLEDVIVIETPDALLVMKRGDSQRVRDVVEAVKAKGGREHIEHRTVRRPWGSYTVLEDHNAGYKLKRIDVKPGHALSLQRHAKRSEHWVVVSGVATVTNGDRQLEVRANESTYIPIGAMHRLENRGDMPLQIVEVQVGSYLGEDDIERFDDVYGRGRA